MAVELIGWVGAVALLAGYAMLTGGRLSAASARFLALNLAGSAGLAVNAAAHSAWPSLVLNLLWLALGVKALAGPRPRSCA